MSFGGKGSLQPAHCSRLCPGFSGVLSGEGGGCSQSNTNPEVYKTPSLQVAQPVAEQGRTDTSPFQTLLSALLQSQRTEAAKGRKQQKKKTSRAPTLSFPPEFPSHLLLQDLLAALSVPRVRKAEFQPCREFCWSPGPACPTTAPLHSLPRAAEMCIIWRDSFHVCEG